MKLTALLASTFGAVALLAAQGLAQTPCSTLAMTWTPANSTLATALTGAPANSPTMLLASLNTGTTTMHMVTLGLAQPFTSMFMVFTDGSGAVNVSRTVANAPTGLLVYFQAVTMDMTGHTHGGGMGSGPHTMNVCVSNVANVQF